MLRAIRNPIRNLRKTYLRQHRTSVRAAIKSDERGALGDLGVKVVGVGSCGVDYLASVATFPKPDEKLRTEKLEVQGGGNCANALTAASRLGLRPVILTKIGDDGLGDGIISELVADGIGTAQIQRAPNSPSPFTYIIVDRLGGTRTCIHTPGAPLTPEDLNSAQISDLLTDAALVYFDGRLTEAALVVAAAARERGIPVLVEAERLRPSLDSLLQHADYVVTSAHFPQEWTGESDLGDAVLATALRLPRAKLLVTTLGSRGSIALERPGSHEDVTSTQHGSLDSIMADLSAALLASEDGSPSTSASGCDTKDGHFIRAGQVVQTDGYVEIGFRRSRDAAAAQELASAAATRAALVNADAGRAAAYGGAKSTAGVEAAAVTARVYMGSIAHIPEGAMVDTTGAGDAFIGAILYGICSNMALTKILRLAATVAACKCCALGARPGLPHHKRLREGLL